jgi:hypothetical protein
MIKLQISYRYKYKINNYKLYLLCTFEALCHDDKEVKKLLHCKALRFLNLAKGR